MTIKTRFIHTIFRICQSRKIASYLFKHPFRTKKLKFPNRFKKNGFSQFSMDNRDVVSFNTEIKTKQHIIFLHGGGYCVEALPAHWWLMGQFMKKTNFKLTFIDYPLSPEHQLLETFEMVKKSYLKLSKIYPNDEFILMGDSAGGGLSLSLSQYLRDIDFINPAQKIVLLSPWVDATMSNPDIKSYEKKDLILSKKTLIESGKIFAGEATVKHPIMSPLFAECHDLKSIGIFVGTHEIFLPDCRLLKNKIEKTNTHLFYKEYEGMIHDWALFPVSERHLLVEDVCEYLLE